MKGTRHREEQIIGILKQGEQDWPPPSYAVSTTLQNRPTIAGKRSAGAWKPGKAKKLKQLGGRKPEAEARGGGAHAG